MSSPDTRSTIYVTDNVVRLPLPTTMSNMTVEEAVLRRRSIRDYTEDPVKLEHLSMILWACYGVTDPQYGLRSSPSAGATYPLEIYVVVGERSVAISNGAFLKAGVYKYDPHSHTLLLVKKGDVRSELAVAALGQDWVRKAPLSVVIAAVFERTTRVYSERGRERYVPMEVGHAGQNVYLMATALGYGTVAVGAFSDSGVKAILGLRQEETPMYIMPVGVPRSYVNTIFEDIWRYIEANR